MAKKPIKGLGRGLSDLSGMGQDALFGQPESKNAVSGAVTLPISQVEPGLNQPRKRFEPEALADLAESIRTHGIIQPITVRKLTSGYYQIIAGERRWRAAKAAGLDEVPAVIIEADDRKVMELGLIENLQREDLNPVEEARGYQVLIQDHGLTQEEVAQRMGKSRPAITNALRLLALPEAVLILLEEGSLSAGHARAILAAPSPELQIQAAQQTATQNLSVRQTEALVKLLQKAAQEPKAKPKGSPDIAMYLAEVEKSLASRYGRKVRIVDKGNKGRIELEYYNIDDLDALLSALEQTKGGAQG